MIKLRLTHHLFQWSTQFFFNLRTQNATHPNLHSFWSWSYHQRHMNHQKNHRSLSPRFICCLWYHRSLNSFTVYPASLAWRVYWLQSYLSSRNLLLTLMKLHMPHSPSSRCIPPFSRCSSRFRSWSSSFILYNTPLSSLISDSSVNIIISMLMTLNSSFLFLRQISHKTFLT